MREIPFRPKAGLNPFAVYGLAGFTISLIVHLGTFFSSHLSTDHPLFWILHVAIFPLFFATLASSKKTESLQEFAEATPRSKPTWWVNRDPSQVNLMSLIGSLPTWARVLVFAMFAYAFVNFFYAMLHLPEKGSDVTMLGQPVDADDVPRYGARAFSGHWLLFYLLPTLHFLYKPRSDSPS